MGDGAHESTTDCDSHANMMTVGRHCKIIQFTGQHAVVHGFTDDLSTLEKVPIVDVLIAYDDKITSKTYLLVARNALHIPTNSHNLVPPFLMREAGLLVDEEPKCQAPQPTIENHSIFDEGTGLRIHLKLNGIFSYFPTRAPTDAEVENWEDYEVIWLTPDSPVGTHMTRRLHGTRTVMSTLMATSCFPTQE